MALHYSRHAGLLCLSLSKVNCATESHGSELTLTSLCSVSMMATLREDSKGPPQVAAHHKAVGVTEPAPSISACCVI